MPERALAIVEPSACFALKRPSALVRSTSERGVALRRCPMPHVSDHGRSSVGAPLVGSRNAPQCPALMRNGSQCPLVTVADSNAAGVGACTRDRSRIPVRLCFFVPLRSNNERGVALPRCPVPPSPPVDGLGGPWFPLRMQRDATPCAARHGYSRLSLPYCHRSAPPGPPASGGGDARRGDGGDGTRCAAAPLRRCPVAPLR